AALPRDFASSRAADDDELLPGQALQGDPQGPAADRELAGEVALGGQPAPPSRVGDPFDQYPLGLGGHGNALRYAHPPQRTQAGAAQGELAGSTRCPVGMHYVSFFSGGGVREASAVFPLRSGPEAIPLRYSR